MVSPDSYSHFKPRPKSRDPFYSVSSDWSDVTPIALIEGRPQQQASSSSDNDPSQPQPPPAPALATIAYSQRYSDAMSYLRAVMAKNEFSLRSVALTEDIIGMNPAHYTVWLFRMKCLKSLWAEGQDEVLKGVEDELAWLEGVSERNLKNYQIWHHRQTLLTLLPSLPSTEVPFLTHILSFDHKNYHVWTYRQWLCRQFPDPLLLLSTPANPNQEIVEIDIMIDDDIRNNSAWNHRYFVVFGAEELDWLERKGKYADNDDDDDDEADVAATTNKISLDATSSTTTKKFKPHRNRKSLFLSNPINGSRKNSSQTTGARSGTLLAIDQEVVGREIEYTKVKIEIAPQNPSAWNYLKGVLRRAGIPLRDVREFCEGFVVVGVDEEREFEDVSGSSGDSTGGATAGDEVMQDVVTEESSISKEAETGSAGQKRANPRGEGDENKDACDDEIDFLGDQVRSSHAIEWLAEIYALSDDQSDEEEKQRTKGMSRRCFDALSQKWDPIRENYWEYKAKQLGV